MEEDPDRELEHYVWQHKHEPLRKIRNGMLKEKGRTKSTKWIKPRRDAARQADQLPEVEVVLPIEEEIKGDEEEEKVETPKDQETESEDDPEIIKINLQTRRVNAEKKRVDAMNLLEEEKKKLEIVRLGVKTVKELHDLVSELKRYHSKDEKIIRLLKQKLEAAMKVNPNYYPDATCPECKADFLWRVADNWFKCYVCGNDYKPKDS
jgi:hypothetical protein